MASSSSTSRTDSRRILESIGRNSFVTQRGLAAVLDEINEFGMPDATSRSTINRARTHELFDVDTPYGKVIRRSVIMNAMGSPLSFYTIDPRACLHHFGACSANFKSFLLRRLRAHPCSPDKPWNIVIYNDEIVNGNPLRHEILRKLQSFYFSFREFGPRALSSEYLWFTVAAARSHYVNELDGGIGRYARDTLLLFEDFATVGFQIDDIIIWAKVSTFVADESALKMCLGVKGPSLYTSLGILNMCMVILTYSKTLLRY